MLRKAVAGGLESDESGAFVGTPDFASPEQFAGVQVDICSDLYSLDATLWKMVTGQAPFRGTSAEMMHQHLHAPLAIGQLDHVPQPVVVLIEMLLEKDPGRRFQNPAELLKVIPMIIGVIDAGRRVTRPQMNLLTLLSPGLVIRIRGSEQPGRRAKDWRN